MPIFHSLEHINLVVYVAALTVCALLNIKAPDEHSTSQPSRNVKPNWQIRLEKKIALYRSDLTKLFNWKANNSKKYIPLLWKYGMNPNHHHFNHKFSYVTDNLKQKIAAFSQRLRRYNKSFKRTSENKMFSRNEKQFYQKLERPANPMYDGLPNKEEVVNYWKTLWSNTTEHKKDSSWIEDERHNYDHVNPMTSSDVTLDDILHVVKRLHNWKSPGLDKIQNYCMQAWCTKLSLSLPMSSGDNTTTRSTIMFESEFIPIKRGIFQGDGWSPMWFCLSLNPLSNILNNTNKGYKLQTSSMFNISHLLYVDDLKIYARNNDELQSLLETTAIFSSDINMQFGIEKCATLEVKRGNIVHQENIELALTPFKFPSLESFYKYLGMSQDLVLNKSEAKEKVKNAYASRMKKILTTELNGQNKIKAINSWCVPILSYSFGIIPWTKTDLQALDRQTRVLMTQHRIHHPRSCMERLYLPRAMGGSVKEWKSLPRAECPH
ncbi:hypothetical protein M8J76_012376 [Diaphorina citri]|nr:hypothetical protein M8J76_012376 [Diaphorina citri]